MAAYPFSLPVRLRVLSAVLFLLVAPLAARAAEPVALRTVQADFSQEKHLPMLAVPLHSEGRFFYRAPADLRWEYCTPFRSVLLLHNGRVRRYREENGTLIEEPAMGMDSMQVILTEISGWLTGRFTDNSTFAVTRPNEKSVVLVPREAGLRSLIHSIELVPGERPGLLESVTINEGEGAFTRMTFTAAVLNRKLDDALFSGP